MVSSAHSFVLSAPSTLLLSPSEAKRLDKVLGDGHLGDLLAKLVSSDVVPTLFRPGALRIRYQPDGLGLVRRDFRVDKAIWFRLGQMARTYGVSRCLLFVALLRAYTETLSKFRQFAQQGRWLLTEIFTPSRYRRTTRLVWRAKAPPGRT